MKFEAMVLEGPNAGKSYFSNAPYINIMKYEERARRLGLGANPSYVDAHFDTYDYFELPIANRAYAFWIPRSKYNLKTEYDASKYVMEKLLAGFMRVIHAQDF